MAALELSFAAHFDLVTIHPFYDGNGRTSRLLMNYIQAYYKLPLAIVYKEDRAEYFQALTQSRKKEDTGVFLKFMKGQYKKLLSTEIAAYRKLLVKKKEIKQRRKGKGYSFFF
jgi:Fic family protein